VSPVRLTSFLLVLRTLAASAGKIFFAPVQGINLGYKGIWVEIGLEVLRGLSLLAATYLGFGLAGLAGGLLGAAIVGIIAYSNLAKRHVPWFGFSRPQKSHFDFFSRFGGLLLVSNIIFRFLLLSDIVILGWVVGTNGVTIFTFTQQICNFCIYLIVIVAGSFSPGFGMLVGAGDWASARRARHEMLSLTWLLTIIMGSAILLWNNSFVSFWVGNQFFGGQSVNLLVVLMLLQTSFLRLDGTLLDASLVIKDKVIWSGISAILAISLAVMLGKKMGLPGVLLGLIAGRGLVSIMYPVLIRKIIQTENGFMRGQAARIILTSLFLISVAGFGGSFFGPVSFPVFFIGIPFSTFVIFICAFYCGLEPTVRQRIRLRLKSIVH
jgi:O-antigen/teichoic acid export membrane protein